MAESIHKLQPNRTLYLRGSSDFGAMAAITQATDTGFQVSGVFRDAADFTVLGLYDADDFFNHPRIKPLPSFDFSGVVLEFDVRYEGLQPIDSIKYPTISWPYMSVAKADGGAALVRLSDYATSSGAVAASTVFSVSAAAIAAGDRVTLWYQNVAFDYYADGSETAELVASKLATQINGVSWGGAQAITATVSGANITVTAAVPGRDGNMIRLYAQSATSSLTLTPADAQLSGGSSDVTWHVKLDFSLLGLTQVRQLWMTFAPATAINAEYVTTEWKATFSNWTVMGANRALQVAGPGSVRVEESDGWCSYTGRGWSTLAGFYSRGFARATSVAGDSVKIKYYCQYPHSLYLGTGLYPGRGTFRCSLDGDAATQHSTAVQTDSEIPARRILRAAAAGSHTVTLTAQGDGPVYFDFIEAVVPSDIQISPGPWANRSPAIDYDTDHGYKLSPARLMWMMDSLGYQGGINLYMGVFWYNQRKRSGGHVASATVDFSRLSYSAGTGFGNGDGVFVQVGEQTFGKTVFPADTASSIAAHFAYFIGETSAGVWASSEGPVLTVTAHAAGHAFDIGFSAWRYAADTTRTPMVIGGSLTGGVVSEWVVDTDATPALNRAVRDWLADMSSECARRGRELTVSYSMELVNPPSSLAARFPDGTIVATATGFSTLLSTQCAPIPALSAYLSAVYLHTADIMAAAGLTPILQFGEWLWWYFAGHGGMAFYDDATKAAAQSALGRALHTFLTPNDSPAVNNYADANFLGSQLDAHMRTVRAAVRAVHSGALFEILLPLDVLYRKPTGHYNVGGALNHYVGIPATFHAPDTAPFDRIKMEALDWDLGTRSNTLADETIRFPFESMNWPKHLCRYNLGVSNGGATWARGLLAARDAGIAEVVLWAWDHVNLFGWPLEDPVIHPTAAIL